MEYDNTNTGILTRNQNRETDKHPEYRGSVNVNGEEFWLSAWVREGKEGGKLEGQKYFSLSLTPKDAPKAAPKAASKPVEIEEDDVPF